MGGVSFQVRVIANRFPDISRSIGSDGAAHTERVMDDLAELARDLAPYRTGALVRSIKRVGAGFKSSVVAEVAYAIFVEFGTIHMRAQPFMHPAVEAIRSTYIQGWRSILQGTGLRSGSITVLPTRRVAGPGNGSTARRAS